MCSAIVRSYVSGWISCITNLWHQQQQRGATFRFFGSSSPRPEWSPTSDYIQKKFPRSSTSQPCQKRTCCILYSPKGIGTTMSTAQFGMKKWGRIGEKDTLARENVTFDLNFNFMVNYRCTVQMLLTNRTTVLTRCSVPDQGEALGDNACRE